MSTERTAVISDRLRDAYRTTGLWGESEAPRPLPEGVERGSDAHLAYLTLVYTISGGREPVQLWEAARTAYAARPDLFDPQFLAYIKPQEIEQSLHELMLTRKRKSEATVWQRIGQALIMRAGGSVGQLLANHAYQAATLRRMLADNKATFPVLSGPQTAPRWLYGLANAGQQPLEGAGQLPVPVSPDVARAMEALQVTGQHVSAEIFDALSALGRRGCKQRPPGEPLCPVRRPCPVSEFCQYGGDERILSA